MKTFNYSSKASVKGNLTEIITGVVLIVVILALVGLYIMFKAWRKIRQAGKLSAKSSVITVDGNKVSYPEISKGKVETRSFLLSEISNIDYNYGKGILTVSLANGSSIKFDLDFFDGQPQLKEFVESLKK